MFALIYLTGLVLTLAGIFLRMQYVDAKTGRNDPITNFLTATAASLIWPLTGTGCLLYLGLMWVSRRITGLDYTRDE